MESSQPKLRFPEFTDNLTKYKLSEKMNIFRGASPRPQGDPRYYGGIVPRVMIQDATRDGKYVYPKIDFLTELGSEKSRLLKKGSVILSCSGTIVAIPTILGVDACIHDGWLGFNDLKDVETEFLYYSFVKLHEIMQGSATTGGVFNNLTTSIIKDYEINFPSLKEQTKIANFLSSVDEKINLLKEKKALLEDYKKGIMQKIFNQEIRFKDDNGNDFEDWVEIKLSDFAEVNKGNQLNKDDLNNFDTYPCISGGIEPSGYTNKFNREENTIIISEGGNSCGYVNFIKTKFWCGGHCYSIDILNNFSKVFVYQLLKNYQDEIMRLRVGSGLPNIQKKDLKSLTLVLPISISEQIKIANFLSSIDEKIELVSTQIDDTQEYKKGLLQQMFV